ncbi:MAG: hypothetical protein UV64_C0016G0013 [Parcubacteria group bacterium GW2011_GWC1_43_11b]|uniref:Uncharacterized protein n=1 Tax=Candidatus Vogelbacteria bacterium RIFOXYB1_FULL_42_16 TaxID=1802436 RepID=A0A1G2QFK4_9BACT|nr:MAG: hypothetical protein UV50_C0010G0018 [Parcubacteria group bacterium GW2011_GWB1_42_9]KKS88959.1 MAG: hypothetical protein UV64_C0016G0013 [Parcubacteria group bacterium GW2011_GWC1_43_11b]KKT09377.1 MAG: hypothetical protein UV88_C0011G0021 [Parcubacteria group bacterium GW2011_GWA1_43_21]OHA58751.1 MAG: hypothetical protein A2370_02180 [Candidatus Vogelbacteria bacterium RIFOXYB1_FULL_42_16]
MTLISSILIAQEEFQLLLEGQKALRRRWHYRGRQLEEEAIEEVWSLSIAEIIEQRQPDTLSIFRDLPFEARVSLAKGSILSFSLFKRSILAWIEEEELVTRN